MRDDIATALRAGSQEFADTVRPPAAGLVRARGDKRRRRLAAGSAAIAVLLAGGVVTGYQVIAGRPGGAGSVLTDRGLDLVAPSRYAEGLPNPVSFTVPGTGSAATVTVSIDLGRPRYVVYRKPVVLRRDAAAGRWVSVPVAFVHGQWRSSYPLRVPGWPTAQRLLVVPAEAKAAPPWAAGRLRVRVTADGKLLGAQSGPSAALASMLGSWRPYYVPDVPRGTTRKLTYTVRNPAALGYRLRVSVAASLCPAVTPCRLPPGDAVQWLDGRTWRSIDAAAYRDPMRNGESLGTVSLRPGGTVTVRLRLVAGPRAQPAHGVLILTLTPAAASLPGLGRQYPATPMSTHPGIITLG